MILFPLAGNLTKPKPGLCWLSPVRQHREVRVSTWVSFLGNRMTDFLHKNPAQLEAAIVAQGAIAQAFYRVGARTASVAAFCRLADLVAQRTPETVARMEAERGLA
jgi:hypothetical protein